MKIILDGEDIKIYLNKEYTKITDINNIAELEEYLSKIFFRLKKEYKIEIVGYYELKILYDKFYGFIIILKKHDFEYSDLFESQIDLDLTINKTNFFLYEIDDLFVIENKIMKNATIYIYKQKLYLKLISDIPTLEMGKLMEFSNLIYGDEVNKIINKGKTIFI